MVSDVTLTDGTAFGRGLPDPWGRCASVSWLWPSKLGSRSIAVSQSTNSSKLNVRWNLRGRQSRSLARCAHRANEFASSTGWLLSAMGQVAAKNILGRREKFDAVPFFWSQHYDVAFNYERPRREVGCYRDRWEPRCTRLSRSVQEGGRTLATVTISRDLQSLQAETALEVAIRSQRREVA